ncbi:MAG: hypothetical protein KY469_22365 [Actinobacteria bacterium]|nr:hypothetical protein [Actinomycetota bacterium]
MLQRLRDLFDRYPIRRRAVLVGVLAEVVIIATVVGIAPETVDQVHIIGGSAINIGALIGLVTSSEPKVTPVADPTRS